MAPTRERLNKSCCHEEKCRMWCDGLTPITSETNGEKKKIQVQCSAVQCSAGILSSIR